MILTWTEQDVVDFLQYIWKRGGDVMLPVRLTRDGGIEAQIIPPDNAPAGWAQTVLAEYERNRK